MGSGDLFSLEWVENWGLHRYRDHKIPNFEKGKIFLLTGAWKQPRLGNSPASFKEQNTDWKIVCRKSARSVWWEVARRCILAPTSIS